MSDKAPTQRAIELVKAIQDHAAEAIQSAIDAAVREALEQAANRGVGWLAELNGRVPVDLITNEHFLKMRADQVLSLRAAILGEGKCEIK